MTLRYFKDGATNASRSLQIYLILIGAAKRRETMTYQMLADEIYEKPAQHVLGDKLEPLMQWCKANDLPALTALVVDKTTGEPREGLTTVIGGFPAEQQRVFAYRWNDLVPPTNEDLKG